MDVLILGASRGIGFELARLDSIGPEPHDQVLDAMVTEAGLFRPARPAT